MNKRLILEEALELVNRFKLVDDHAYLRATQCLRNIYKWNWFVREGLQRDDELYGNDPKPYLYRVYLNTLFRYWYKLTGGDI